MIKQLLPFLALLPGLLHAQVIPFNIDGALDKVELDSDEYNTGTSCRRDIPSLL